MEHFTEGSDVLRCSADHLLKLIERIKDAQSNAAIGARPMPEAMPALAQKLDFESYMDMLSEFMALAGRVREDITLLSLRRENVRNTLFNRLREIEEVFDAGNFSGPAGAIFNRHFSDVNVQALEDISERLESQGLTEKPLDQLTEAVEDAKKAAKTAEEFSELSGRARMLIKTYLDQLVKIMEDYDELGEQDFWNRYRVLFSTFVELHESIADPDGKEKNKASLQTMLSRLVLGSSLTANAVAIGTPIIGLLSS